jgi:hypothetical protein
MRSYPLGFFSCVLGRPTTRQMAYPMDVPVIDLTATDSEGSTDDSDSDIILESDEDTTFEQRQ